VRVQPALHVSLHALRYEIIEAAHQRRRARVLVHHEPDLQRDGDLVLKQPNQLGRAARDRDLASADAHTGA